MRHAFLLSLSLSLLIFFALSGCDSASDQQELVPSFEDIGRLHNAAVAEVFEQISGGADKAALLTDPEHVGRLVWQTPTVRALAGIPETYESYLDELRAFRAYLYERIGPAKNDSLALSIETLHEAGVLSAAQVSYIEALAAIEPAGTDTVAMASSLRAIEAQAYAELGDEANVVLIYGATLRHSMAYWHRHGGDWVAATGQTAGKSGDVDWAEVARFDAGGAVTGAVFGVIAGAKAAAGTSLVFGPGGGVLVFTGAVLKSAIGTAAGVSITRAVASALEDR